MRPPFFQNFCAAHGHSGWSRSRRFSGHPFHQFFSQMMGSGQRAERGEVRYLILDALSDQARHGYDVIKEIENRSDGQYKPSTGAIYPALQMLEEAGYVRSREEDGRKLYEITDEGRKELEENQEEVDGAYDRLGWPSSFFHGEYFMAMGRQLERMFKAMRRAFRKGRITPQAMDEINLILEQTADRIEEILKSQRTTRSGGQNRRPR